MLNNILEIILITYNRKEHLEKTFKQIFAENSPIKNLQFTILNNKSTDGTYELIEEYKSKFPNIKHIVHNQNIGGNANIARAFEIATSKYFWILCDDDEYDFTHWSEVEKAILSEDNDAIVVSYFVNKNRNIAQLIKQMTFVPSTIYKSSLINSTVMTNIEFMISTMFPQLGIILELVNQNKKIKIMENWICKMIPNIDEGWSYTRGLNDSKHPYMQDLFWEIGFINAIQMIKDSKTRTFVIENMSPSTMDKTLENIFQDVININRSKYFKNPMKNLFDLFVALNWKQRILFLYVYLKPFNINYDTQNNKLNIKIGPIKTYIRFKEKKINDISQI